MLVLEVLCQPWPQPELAGGRQASLFDTCIDQTLVISASKTHPRWHAVFPGSIQLPPSFPVRRSSKGGQGALWRLQGHMPHCRVLSGIFCDSVKHFPGQHTSTNSWAHAHTISTQGAGVQVGGGLRVPVFVKPSEYPPRDGTS